MVQHDGMNNQPWIFTYQGDDMYVSEDYYNGTITVTSLYFMGGIYEVTDPSGANTLTRYFSLGAMLAKYDGSDLKVYADGPSRLHHGCARRYRSNDRQQPRGGILT